MRSLASRCTTVLQTLDDRSTREVGGDGLDLRRDGDVWILTSAMTSVYLRNAKGTVYLAELLRHPGQEMHALDLVRLLGNDDDLARPTSTSEDLIDDKARRAYEQRIDATIAELERAEAMGDPESVVVLRSEVEALRRELARGVGIGGRLRSISSAERARSSVTRAIRLALGHIDKANPEIGAVLTSRIRTGTYCCYDPSPSRRELQRIAGRRSADERDTRG